MPSDYRTIYEPVAKAAAQAAGIPVDLFIRLIMAESGFDPTKVSSAGAKGIAQIMPQYHPTVNPDDPVESLYYAARHLADLHRTFGDWQKAAAAYVSGSGNVQNAISMGGEGWLQHLVDNLKPEERLKVRQYIAYVTGETGVPQEGPPGAQMGWPDPKDYIFDPSTGAVDWNAYIGALSEVAFLYSKSGQPLPADAPPMAQMIYDADMEALKPDVGKERRANLASYIDALVSTLGQDVEARRLRLDEAVYEFDKRLKAKEWAQEAWVEMSQFAVPAGAKYLPGFGPGGIATKVGMEPVEADAQWFDPFEMAQQMVSGVDMTGIGAPETGNLFEQALMLTQQRGAAAPGAVPGAAPVVGAPLAGAGAEAGAGGIPWTPAPPGYGLPGGYQAPAGTYPMTPAPPGTGLMTPTPPGGGGVPMTPAPPAGYDPQSGWYFNEATGKWVFLGAGVGGQ